MMSLPFENYNPDVFLENVKILIFNGLGWYLYASMSAYRLLWLRF